MWITRFGNYINRGWKEAATVALIFAIIPFMGWAAIVVMALITLRQGAKQGLIILLISSLPSLIYLTTGHYGYIGLAIALSGNLLTWFLALVLREKADWGKVFVAALWVLLAVALLLHGFIPKLTQFWDKTWQQVFTASGTDVNEFLDMTSFSKQQYFLTMAKWTTSILMLMQLVVALSNLAIARYWQAQLFNPGGFKKEFLCLRLNGWAVLILVGCILACFLDASVGWYILPSVILVFVIAGLIVLHQLKQLKQWRKGFVWLFYGLIILFLPYSLALVATMGAIGAFIDFRDLMRTQT